MKKYYVYVLFVFAAVIVVSAAASLWHFSAPAAEVPPPQVPFDAAAVRKNATELIATTDAGTAYQTLQKQYAHADYNTQHIVAHIFGETLYEAEGVRGVAVCDSAFNFGCFHGLFIRAVAAEGLGVVATLDQVCRKSKSAFAALCQHGIGHGILEYLGRDHLLEALGACKKTDQPNPVEGCTSGVFMEYNVAFLPSSDSSGLLQIRPLADPEKPYDPCPSLSPTLQLSCYRELPQWWKLVYRGDFHIMGKLCDALTGEGNRFQCFAGIGGIVPPTVDYDAGKTIALCAGLPAADAEAICRGQAAWAFVSNVHDFAGAAKVCDLPILREKKVCPSQNQI